MKKAMIKLMAIPPPPMPATVHRAITRAKVKTPSISRTVDGNTPLWPQTPGIFAPQM